nr:unnamed protein product [Callosobruchus analis]
MKIIIVFCILSIWIFKIKRSACRDMDFDSKLDKYLKIQSDDMISDFHKHSVSKRDADNIEISPVKHITLDTSKINDKPILFSLNGDVYIIQSLEVSKIDIITFALSPAGKLSRIGSNEYVSFTGENAILFVRTQIGNTHVYNFRDTNISFLHSLYLPYFKDCKFFIQDTSLYLAVINNQGDNLSDLMIYKWLGTHLDEISRKNVRSAIEIHTFPTTNSAEILIVLHKSAKMVRIYTGCSKKN